MGDQRQAVVADACTETVAEQHDRHDALRIGSMTRTSGMGTTNLPSGFAQCVVYFLPLMNIS